MLNVEIVGRKHPRGDSSRFNLRVFGFGPGTVRLSGPDSPIPARNLFPGRGAY